MMAVESWVALAKNDCGIRLACNSVLNGRWDTSVSSFNHGQFFSKFEQFHISEVPYVLDSFQDT